MVLSQKNITVESDQIEKVARNLNSITMTSDVIIVDVPQELLNDAMWHLEREREHETNPDPFPLWREVRATALFAVTAIEAFINKPWNMFEITKTKIQSFWIICRSKNDTCKIGKQNLSVDQ